MPPSHHMPPSQETPDRSSRESPGAPLSSFDEESLSGSGNHRLWHFRMGLGGKLIAAMLFICIVEIVAVGIATRIGFDRGFIDYLNNRGVAKLESLQPIMVAEYQKHGGWDFLLASPQVWFEIVGIPGNTEEVPPIGSPIPEHDYVDTSGASLRIALLDSDRKFIIGNLEDNKDSVERPVQVNKQTVGWLTYKPSNELVTEADLRFKKRQDIITIVIGIGAVILAAGLAILLSAKLIKTLRPIRKAVGELARGNYQVQLPDEIDDEIGDLSADVNHLALVLDRNESVRRNLMADVSHELRTPIAILQAELESIQDGVQAISKDSLRSLLSEVKTLGILVEDVYEVSSSDVGALSYRMEPVDISDILECTVHAFDERRKQRDISLELTGLSQAIYVDGDRGRLNQLFNNLLENSMRYTYKGGQLKVSCGADSQRAIITFEDSAPCAPHEVLVSLFERSFRAMRRVDNGDKGNGLGLAICKNIVEAHRGEITAEPSNLNGLKVTVSIPLPDNRPE